MEKVDALEEYLDENGLPAELNQLKTNELLPNVGNYSMSFYNNGEQFDPLSDTNGMIVENFSPYTGQIQSPSEIPNSTQPCQPAATTTHPIVQDFEGEYGFTICYEALNGTGTSNSWAYSESLKQVFIKMHNVLVIKFKTAKPFDSDRFFIRALLVYQNSDFLNQPVNRCSIHMMEDDPNQNAHRQARQCDCNTYHKAGHVLRCQTEQALYQFDCYSDRHSVLVPIPRVPQIGSDCMKEVHYFFVCKTSCPRGMQRRAVQMVFTLEDDRYQVYGRSVLPVKICSCPKRDKDRQERDIRAAELPIEKKPTKRPLLVTAEDIKPIKTERETALFHQHLRQATRESLEIHFNDLMTKQTKDFETIRLLQATMEQRQKDILEIHKQLSRHGQFAEMK